MPENINKREQKRDTKAMSAEEKHHISETGLSKDTDFDRIFDRSKMSDDDIVSKIDYDIRHEARYTHCGRHFYWDIM